MARWVVNRNDVQFEVDGVEALRALAGRGELEAGDLVRPPGTNGWVYAVEVPDVGGLFQRPTSYEEPTSPPAGAGAGFHTLAALGMLAIIALSGGYVATNYDDIPDREAVSKGMQLSYSQVVVTGESPDLLAGPEPEAKPVAKLAKNDVLDLLGKRADRYHVRRAAGDRAEGFVALDAVLPAYRLAGADVREEWDPLYNPGQYVRIGNRAWTKDGPRRTTFGFVIQNESGFDMTDLVLVAAIKDSKGHQLEQVEFRVEGRLPANASNEVGQVRGLPEGTRLMTRAGYEELLAAQVEGAPELRFEVGADVVMTAPDFQAATVQIAEIRAVPREREGEAPSGGTTR